MLFDRIRQVAHAAQRLSPADTHTAVAVNTGGDGRVTAVSSVSTSAQGGDMEKENDRAEPTEDELEGVEGGCIPSARR
jgi:hypothetical protein